ncbi:hypothetical protein P1X15_01935 [Runella sp. MFBS21]|uniref:hypothetical protein n=1 Tax=Runella sp. MFBS21 TaxID=3034018 RepID=UPI0023F88D3A|nr:hypothetical protein [Runella sp. MFBS21]MDF7816327.1 hypothetical protein [Runella sp. MFBS21]
METTKKHPKYYEVIAKGDDLLDPVDYHQLVNHPSFCGTCGQPLAGIKTLPDIQIKEMYKKQCSIYYMSHFKGVPVWAIHITLLEELAKFVKVEDYLMLGTLLDAHQNIIETYRTFLPRYYLFVRGSIFFEKTCEACHSYIYSDYRAPYLPRIVIGCPIPLFGVKGASLMVNTEIGLHLKALKLPCLSVSFLKIQQELPQNAHVPLYKTYF